MKLKISLLAAGVATALTTAIGVGQASALSGSSFQAGRIIDDAVFYDSGSMSVAQIQSFLYTQVPTCDSAGNNYYVGTYGGRTYGLPGNGQGLPSVQRKNLDSNYPAPYTCLKDYYENTSTKENNIGRPGTIPSGAISAAQIIYNESQTYGISPKVMLTLIQKESAGPLTTDDWPWPTEYKAVTGYGCPDTTGCDTSYYGFYNQIHLAARQFRLYTNSPNSYNYRIGTNQIKYHPDPSSCGTQTVNITNQATANLYNYTPYVPNQAALNNLYGLGDGCSAYGNRNFWRIYNDWFGSTYSYDYSFVSATNPPSVMQPGQTATATVVLRNRGGQIWWDETNALTNRDPAGGGAPTPYRLATTQPDDHNNPFGGGTGWVGQNRMTMLSGKTSPGDIGTFQFTYTAPTTPGTYTEHFAPVAENVTKLPDVGMAFTVTVPKVYSYQIVSATNPPSVMQPGQTATATVVLKNTGNVTWGNETSTPSTPFRLYTAQPNDHNNPFGGSTGWVGQNRMTMVDSSVAPGQNGTFTFSWTAPQTPGLYKEHFAPTIENVTKLNDIGMEFDVTVPDRYGYKFVSAVNPPANMSKGQTASATVVLQNLGSTVWGNESNTPATPFRLFTARANDHNNPFGGGTGWVGQNRMTMQTATVAYGANGTFVFDWTAPQVAGRYCEYFAPTIENVIKLPDIGMAFCVNVQ